MTKKLIIEPNVLAVIKAATFTRDSLQITAPLDRSMYVKVNKVIESVGGKWNKGRKAHLFQQDPRELFNPETARLEADKITFESMKAALKAGVQVVSAPQLFPTPQGLAERMIEEADIQPGHDVLEPSAGTGNLIKAMPCIRPNGALTAVEINYSLAAKLEEWADVTICGDFLEQNGTLGKFDRIVMNPPFTNGSDIKHIRHAIEFLKPGGRLVALCANGPRQKAALEPLADLWEPLPAGSFSEQGTNVNVALLVINAPEERSEPRTTLF